MSLNLNPERKVSLNGHESSPGLPGNQPSVRPNPNQPQTPRRRGQWGWLVAACLVVGAILMPVFRHHTTAQTSSRSKMGAASQVVQVSTSVARKGDIGIYVNALG